MEILFFILGFIFGCCAISVPFLLSQRQSKELMKQVFENTASKIFEQNSEKFSVQNSQRLNEVFAGFREKLEDFEKLNRETIRAEQEKLAVFDTNIKSFIGAGAEIQNNINSYIRVMQADNRSQGAWGEIVLEKVLECSGLRKDVEYVLQKKIAEGKPDATVCLPDEKVVYIDSKTSLSSWFAYVNAQSEEEKKSAQESFKASTKKHIDELADKNYSAEEKSPEYVLMFIPIEGCYSLMFCDECTLWDYAWKQGVMPVSPSTLLASLKIINTFHVTDRQNKNALEISKACSVMLERFSELVSELLKIRTSFDTCLKKLQGKGNICSQIDKVKNLGVKINKDIPKISE